MQPEILFQQEIVEALPDIRLGCLSCSVKIKPSDQAIKDLSEEVVEQVGSRGNVEEISSHPVIKSTKEAYRKLGKDPSRYRPSAEALTRRVTQGKGLYKINNVVDVLNIISLQSGFSIGGYDLDKINGDIMFGKGKADEPYEAIGRGTLNIENLPLFRDTTGAFGSPTSDSVRTMVSDTTSNFLMVIIDFTSDASLESTLDQSKSWYEKYVGATKLETLIISTKA